MYDKIALVVMLGLFGTSCFADQITNDGYVDKSEYNRTLGRTRVYDLTLNSIYKAYYKAPNKNTLDASYRQVQYLYQRDHHQEQSNSPQFESLHLLDSATYQDNQGQTRYIVAIEGKKLQDDPFHADAVVAESCNACFPSIDLFMFEKDQNGNFKLLSRTDNNHPFSDGAYGESVLHEGDLKKSLQDIGQNLKALFVKGEFEQMGDENTNISILILNENKPIALGGDFDFAEDNAGGSNTVKFSSRYVLNQNVGSNEFYPLIVESVGTHFNKAYKPVPYNVKRTYKFNGQKFVLANTEKLSDEDQKGILQALGSK